MQRISDYVASWFKKEELPAREKRVLPKKEASVPYSQRDMFFANMSHEIRTPVNGIVGFTQLLKETGLSKEQHELVNTIHSSSMHLLGLVNDILDFSKINAHKMVLEETEFDLFRQIEDTIETYAAAAQEKDIVLGLYMDPTIVPSLIGDPSKLSQILINLVSNAVKFTDALGRVDILVEKLAESQKTVTLRFSVKDTGIGIGVGAQKTVFNAFTQENSSISRKFGGTGLGLAISSELVKLMGGELALESEKEKGSEFYFSLTFEKVRVQEREIYADRYRGLSAGIVLPKREGLRGAEDNLKSYIAYLGVDVRFYNSVEIVSMDPKVLPDLLFADERYSGISFKDLCKLPVKVISLSPINRQGAGEEQECLCKNIYKPVNLTKTIRAFEACLESDTPSSQESMFTNRNFKGFKALVVDDNRVNQKLMMQVLENMQLDVELAADGAEALMHYMSSDFDILFMDIQMPVMDGLEAAEKIIAYEKEEGKNHTPIIALTGNTESAHMQKYSDAGMDGIMSKPVDMTVMVSYLNQYLATQKLAQQIGKAEAEFSGAKVLIIEENSINQKLIEQALASKGVKSVLINRASTFMNVYRKEVFNMIFVSASMPMMAASKIIQDIRLHEKKKGLDTVPIIVLVPSDTSDAMCENYRKSGAQGCLPKPLEIDEIKLQLDRHMQAVAPKQEMITDDEVHVGRGEEQEKDSPEDEAVVEPVGDIPTPGTETLALAGLAAALSSEDDEVHTEAEQAEEIEEKKSGESGYHQWNDEEPLPMLKEELGIIQNHENLDQTTEERGEAGETVYPVEALDLLSEAAEEMPELRETEQKQETEEQSATENEALSESLIKMPSLGKGALTSGGLTTALSLNDDKTQERREQEEQEQREKEEKAAREKAEQEQREKEEREEAERVEKERKEKERKKKEAREKREKEEKEKAEKEKAEKEAREKAEKEQREREEKEEREKAEREKKEKEAREKEARERKEKEEKAEKELREKEERVAREKAEKEEKAEQEQRKKEEREAQEKKEKAEQEKAKQEKAKQEEREREEKEEKEAQEKTEKEAREKAEPETEQPAEVTKTREAEKQDVDIGGKKHVVTYIDIPLSK